MLTIQDITQLASLPGRGVVTVGNFDGVHLAHQKLLRSVVDAAKGASAIPVALTFDPHPIKVLAPGRAPKLLTPLRSKAWYIETTGIERLVVLPFTRELARLSPLEFVREILVKGLRTLSVHVGPNFRFGYRQSGDVENLREIARLEGFEVSVLPALEIRGEMVSSTRIRELLSLGRVNLAARLLGRPFSLFGPIVAGLGVGRKHTVPTLNLAPIEDQTPKTGVYVTRTRLGREYFDSVTNVGHKPTFGSHNLTVETYLLDYSGEIDKTEMEIEFLFRLRDEMKFQNPAILKIQIQEDARRANKFFRMLRAMNRLPEVHPSQDTTRL